MEDAQAENARSAANHPREANATSIGGGSGVADWVAPIVVLFAVLTFTLAIAAFLLGRE